MVRIETMYGDGRKVWSGREREYDEAKKRVWWMLGESIGVSGREFYGVKECVWLG